MPAADTGRSSGSEAELKAAYDKYKSRMASGARTQLEVLAIPKHYGADETKAAMDMAKSLFERATKGEGFSQLARDYSEGPNAERGGLIDRWLQPSELGSLIAAAVQMKKPGELVEPVQEGGRVLLLKIMDPAQDTSKTKTPPPTPNSVKLAQIVIKVHPSPDALRAQYKEAKAIADRARAVGLSKAATEKGMATVKTGFYDDNNAPPQLFAVPEAADWGLSAKQNEVSQVFEGEDEFVLAQVSLQHEAGPPTRDEVGDQLKMIADAEHRVDMSKPRADSVVAALKAGRTPRTRRRRCGFRRPRSKARASSPTRASRAAPSCWVCCSARRRVASWAPTATHRVGRLPGSTASWRRPTRCSTTRRAARSRTRSCPRASGRFLRATSRSCDVGRR